MSISNKAPKPIYVENLASMPNPMNINMIGAVYYIANIKALWLYTGGVSGTGTTRPTLASGTVGQPSATYNEGSGKFFGLVSGITDTTYSLIVTNDLTNSTTNARTISGAFLRTNFYTKTETTSLLAAKQNTITGGASSITSADLTINRALVSDSAGKVIVSGITSTELGRLYGVTSNIQDQLDGKQDTITGAATTITSGNLTANRALISNGNGKVWASAVTATELGYLDGVTSGIQAQINGKQNTITGAATTITSSNLTANRALVSNGSGKVAVSAVTSTQLGYLSGATSNIQAQLDGKSQRIILTGQLQTTSYRRSVIALCELTNTNPSANSYSVGTITFHRTNGLSSAVKYDFAIEKRYNIEGFNLSQTVLASGGFVNGIKPCIFVKNGIKYGGIEIFFSNAELSHIEFHGTTNFEIFGLDYYVENTSTPLDTEVNNSLVFDDPTNIRLADAFKVGDSLVASQPWVTANTRSNTWVPSWGQVTGKPTFATVATSGSYNDLTNKPASLPASDVQAWAKSSQALNADMYLKVKQNTATWVNASGLVSDLGLATVALTGSYNDLTNKPSIPSVNNPTITLSGGTGISVSLGAFTLNQTGNQLITITNSAPNATHTGEVTGSGELIITDGVVTNAKLADMETARIKGRASNGTGAPEDLTQSQVRAFLGLGSAAYVTLNSSNRFVTDGQISSWNNKFDTPTGTTSQYIRGNGSLATFPSIPSSLNNLSDVSILSPSTGQILTYNGLTWGNADKPSYNLGEIAETATYKRVTQTEKNNWNNKWKEIYAGTSSALSKTGTTAITVPSDTYYGKTIAVEIKYGSTAATYTNKVVFVTVGTNTSTTSSKTYPRFVSFSEFDGQYLKNISTKCYVTATGTTSSIRFGYLKTLIGSFSGTTIDWTTQDSDSLSVYIGKIWVLE